MTEWSAEVRARALELWQTEGMAAAHAETGVPKSTIGNWVTKAGLKRGPDGDSTGVDRTHAATLARLAKQAEKRAELQTLLLDKAVDMLQRMDAPHVEFLGRDAVERNFDKAPSGACQRYATSAAILIDKYRLEVGEVTDRHGIDDPNGFVRDARRRGLALLPGGARGRTG